MTFEQQLASFTGLKSDEMTQKFQDLIEEVCSTSTLSNLNVLVSFLLNEGSRVPNTVVKMSLSHLVAMISPIRSEELKGVAEHAITEIKKSNSKFDEADFSLRESLFDYFIRHGMWSEGAEMLGGANFDSNDLNISAHKKVDSYIKCAESYLKDNAGYEAENYLKLASALLKDPAVVKDLQLQLRHRVVFARVLDANKKFNDAALRYYHLSIFQGDLQVDVDNLFELYGKAMACAILGTIGPQRTRVMQLLQNDPRLHQIADVMPAFSAHVSLLIKMSNGNLIQPKELEQFSKSLLPHQNASAGNGFSLPENAVIEHNLFVAGKIYDNIAIKELAKLLSLDVVSAENVTSRMIIKGRLKATINQEEGFVYFTSSDDDSDDQWNDFSKTIAKICEQVNECVEMIETNRMIENVSA